MNNSHRYIVRAEGHRLRMITYDAPLYRGDKMTSNETQANRHYTTRYDKFFATRENETAKYIQNALKGYTKEWKVTAPLHLIDILDLETRQALEHLVEHPALLDTAFPIRHNKVYRYSEDDTGQIDAQLLGELCRIRTDDGAPIEGYYMAKQQPNAARQSEDPDIIGFHSEVGLCRSAFHKLFLTRTKFSKKAPNQKNERNTKKRGLLHKVSSPAKRPVGKQLFSFSRKNNKKNNNNKNNNNNNNNNKRNDKPFLVQELPNLM